MIRVQAWNEFVSQSLLANWLCLRISLQSSLFVIYCLILTAWPWLMSFTCIPVQNEPNKSPLRKRLLALLLWEMGHLSSPSRSCLGRLILILGGRGGPAGRAPPHWWEHKIVKPQGKVCQLLTVKHTIWLSNFTPNYTPKIIENLYLHKNLYINVYSTILITKKWKQSKWWMNKQNVIYPSGGISSSHKN